jgi:hypothetical protein
MALVAAACATGIAAGAENSAPAGDLGAMHRGMANPKDVGDVKVPKATGADARTVSEIISGRASLKGKTVVVRGKVVKFTHAVMGKNWVHLRDGSGTAAENTHDLVVTTEDEAKVGDVVIARGVVTTDVKLGSGYSYDVLVEKASLKK